MILATKDLILWFALGSFIGAIAVEEDVDTTSLFEGQNITTTSPTTPTTTFSSTTRSSTTPSSPSSEATTNASASTAPILARANLISSSSTIRSIISTTTTGTTTKPSAKRQISLNEFQQLVAKVNDEISMLRNQSANLSQTYEELVRRYNERTSQIPIVLYDATECSNSSTLQEDSSTQVTPIESTVVPSTIVSEATDATDTSERATTTADTTITTLTTKTPSSTKVVEDTTQKLTHSEALSDRAPALDAVPTNSGSSHTQIYGNKYYNYIHYFMYPPSEEQLEDINNPSHKNHRRKGGNDSRNAAAVKQRKEIPHQKRNKWQTESREELDERDLDVEQSAAAAFRRRPQTPTGGIRRNLRPGSIDAQLPYEGPFPAISRPYRFGSFLQRNPANSPGILPYPKIPQHPYAADEIPPRISAQQEVFASYPRRQNLTPAETLPKSPVYADKIATFLERRNINRNGPTQRTTIVPARQVTSSATVVKEPVTAPSLESLFSFGAKPVNYSIPTTVKPLPGFARNGWDGYDFSFVRKAQETKKRLQQEQRSSQTEMRDL